ncbi:MAG: hypothetical protein V1742_08705 [Pseudomonadota bacterium]
MVTLIAGIIALILGILGLYKWWMEFIILIQALIPLVLILGGALATYLGIEEWRDSQAMAKAENYSSTDAEAQRYKAEADRLKMELETLKQSQTQVPEKEDETNQ